MYRTSARQFVKIFLSEQLDNSVFPTLSIILGCIILLHFTSVNGPWTDAIIIKNNFVWNLFVVIRISIIAITANATTPPV